MFDSFEIHLAFPRLNLHRHAEPKWSLLFSNDYMGLTNIFSSLAIIITSEIGLRRSLSET